MMKIYFFYTKESNIEIIDIQDIKESLYNIVLRVFDYNKEFKLENVVIANVEFSVSIDAYMVIDTHISKTIMSNIKQLTSDTVQQVQDYLSKSLKTEKEYSIRLDVKENYVPPKGIVENVENGMTNNNMDNGFELDYMKRAEMYVSVNPAYSFDRVILPDKVKENRYAALSILQYEKKVFDDWGLYEIQPRPSSSMSFFGPSGTGKTMAAEAIAEKLGKKILKVSYADVESKYHGEGPKMVKAIFKAAERDEAVLFFDEADSLLSKRLTNVSQGSEQAINSMRSQLLICLEEFKGIVIFATNLVINYDHAFLTRLISIEFVNPDEETRKKIWDVHIKPVDDGKIHRLNIPLGDDVDTNELAKKYEFVGREIRNAVISACVSAAMNNKNIVDQKDFVTACDKIVEEKESLLKAKDHTLDSRSENIIKQAVIEKIKKGVENNVPERIE